MKFFVMTDIGLPLGYIEEDDTDQCYVVTRVDGSVATKKRLADATAFLDAERCDNHDNPVIPCQNFLEPGDDAICSDCQVWADAALAESEAS